ncbi:Oligosaccharide translocation protein rft1 [Coemansia sp. RSA 376]|nr:Oligosaccharide translocation protein rft1 [Coemansia sp. S3946]KAJ2110951.1 Oligosaccharide translocation protein rft1 [Coemansia sp. RSA 922]KAJ2263947.1 Oligosaccharide translocation protein rft1 [Coemansia sp. RSA 376]
MASTADSAFSGAQYLMGLQVFVKLATFSMNAVVIYLAGSEAFGVASVRFELLLSTILFLSREGMRSALLRIDVDRSSAGDRARPDISRSGVQRRRPPVHEQRIINAALVPIGVGVAMASALYLFYVTYGTRSSTSTDASHYYLSLALYILAAWIELCVEPLFALSRSRVLFKLQAKCEGVAVAGRCISIVLVLLVGRSLSGGIDNNPFKLVSFAAGQMAYAIFILLSYLWSMSYELEYSVWNCYLPRRVALDSEERHVAFIGPTVKGLAMTFVGQSLLKHLLTQGDNMVMARFATPAEMGIFAFVTNYGSIPARIVFLPLEEASRAMFSKMVSRDGGSARATGSDLVSMSADDARIARHVLTTLGKLHLLIGTILVVFGTLLSPTLLSFIGQGDSAVAYTLTAYCIYLPFMGMNGFLEAFVHCVATKRQLFGISVWMACFTVVYALFAVQMLHVFKLGSTGMVVANMLNMALRIGYCWRFISRWFKQLGATHGPQLAAMIPHPAVLYACLLSGAVILAALTFISQQDLLNRAATLLASAGLGIVVLRVIWRSEQAFVKSALALRSGQLQRPKSE